MPARLRVVAVVWLAMLGADFLLNAGLFAGLYRDAGGFVLPAAEAFRRIPLGYLAFLVVAFGVVELAHRLGAGGLRAGFRLGVVLGGIVGAVWALALYSIATLPPALAAGFAVTWFALLVVASTVAAAGLSRARVGGLALRVAGFDVACLVTVVALQSAGVVPTVTF